MSLADDGLVAVFVQKTMRCALPVYKARRKVKKFGGALLEPVCCKKWQKKSPNQEIDLGNRGHLKVLNDTKLVLNEHE